ncbi:tRNA pseudouridine(38-40) synthase TruA [Chryseotalea sanaruensis]|uniref:tRNA pseudouridine synthase A n=1 Tax=Chryseotalea sanaruensis TaxID=2482724 RepID=A0A401U6U3_9BACT|nr:tRNA pseudouridine(38-40) synthase TruA [Chryseotalea sanaruensis]GCC50684.1 tRNA pseudouridine(38-40) synthase TruA [Chryseotalea sanaruensis]
MRYFFEIAYKGTNYAGWQSQPNAIGVQAVVENALSKLLRAEISILGSGRTDTGVHCEQQFFHVDIEHALDEVSFLGKINSFLPSDVAIRSIQRVKEEAHARFSATERAYEYRITLKKNPFLEGQALYYFKDVDLALMNKAAATLVGVHDFEAFSKVKTDVNNFNCNLKRAEWVKEGDKLIFHISANRFLRGMVRAIVGTLLEVGNGKLSLQDFKLILESKDRKQAGMNVAPHGLFLTRVVYPESIFQQ